MCIPSKFPIVATQPRGRSVWRSGSLMRIIGEDGRADHRIRHKLVDLKALLPLLFVLLAATAAAGDQPSRAPGKGCKWEKVSNTTLGLEAWVQRCDYGFRKIDLFIKGSSLFIRYSDGGAPDPLVDVLPLAKGETAAAGIKRIVASHTDKKLVKRCVLAPYRGDTRPGAKRYTFIPDRAYKKELDAKADPNEVGDPPCGDWGDAPDGIQYFEVQAGVRSVLFVRVGQDEPLFDEKTLRLIK